jgi:hypothetical protein
MRFPTVLSLAAGLALGPAAPAAAQARLSALIGVTGSATLVTDQVVRTIELQPALAPTLLLSASLPIAPTLRAGLDLGYSRSNADLTADGQSAGDLGTLGVFSAVAAVSGPLRSRLSWRVSAGLLKYLPTNDVGVFRNGGPTRALLGAGLDWRQPLQGRWTGLVGLRYDFHLFTTSALEAAGFSRSQRVSRLGLAVGAAWDLP